MGRGSRVWAAGRPAAGPAQGARLPTHGSAGCWAPVPGPTRNAHCSSSVCFCGLPAAAGNLAPSALLGREKGSRGGTGVLSSKQ